jgi:SAM-dependent methyltransferase
MLVSFLTQYTRFLHPLREPLTPSQWFAGSPTSLGERSSGSPREPESIPNSGDPGGRRWQTSSIAAFSMAVFLSAALLFVVEPMFAKMALPLLGGSAAVWTTCLVFFQMTLLAGYAYAHVSMKLLGRRGQVAVHAAVLLAALALLPVHVPGGWTPPPQSNPVGWLLRLLLVAVGLPFFALSATTPILQKWFAQTAHPSSSDPYFLYAASNSGSLLGLLSYPFVLEPLLRLSDQSRLWAYGYGMFLLLVAGCILLLWLARREISAHASALPPDPRRREEEATLDAEKLTTRRRLHWVALAFVPSSLMLGVTTALTTDVPAIPLFWVLPLALYLLSFVAVFARRPWFSHLWVSRRLPVLILIAAIPIALKGVLPFLVLFLLDLLTLFAVAVVCHGEVARSRPATRHLTEFYLWVAVGGVLGGAFNALLAPVIFSTVAELPIALVLAALLCPAGHAAEDTPRARWLDYLLPAALGLAVALATLELQSSGMAPGRLFNLIIFAPAAICCLRFAARPRRFGLGVAAVILASQVYAGPYGNLLLSQRSFFGVYRVSHDAEKNCQVLFHGAIPHGLQSLDVGRGCEPLAYYTRSGPIGQVFEAFRDDPVENEVAVIGLGAGVMACYHQASQRITFYEIDPTILRIAQNRRYFTYLSDCGSRVRVVLGDARLSLRDAPAHGYGLMVLDAFSGDSIPTHLLTREALALYLSKLAPNGILAFDISNRYLDLHGVLGDLARDAGMACLVNDDLRVSEDETREGKFASTWVVMARHANGLEALRNYPGWKELPAPSGSRVWTDDFSNIVSILKFN